MLKDLIKQDINFLENPLWFQNDRLAEQNSNGFVWQDKEGYLYRAGYKPPVKTDVIILFYILMQSQKCGWAETIELTRYQILNACGMGTDAGSYSRLEDSLRRWKYVGLEFQGTFYDNKEYLTKVFGIIDGYEISKKDKKLKIWFSPPYLTKMRETTYFRYLNFDQVKVLRSSLATRLYEILCKSFKNRDVWEINAFKLATKIPMEKLYPSQIVQKIQPAINRIYKHTDLKVTMEVRKQDRGKIILLFKKETTKPKELPVVAMPAPFGIPDNEDFKKLVSMLLPGRQSQKTLLESIARAFKKHGYKYVARNIKYANKHAKGNYRAYLIKTLNHDWGLGLQEDEEAFAVNKEAKEQVIRESAQKQQIEEKKRFFEQELLNRAREYQSNLSATALEELRQEAILRLDPNVQEAAKQNKPAARVPLKMAMDKISIERMHIDPPIPAEKEKTQES